MAQQADGTIYINTKINSGGVEAGSAEIQNALKNTAKTVSEIGNAMSGYSKEAMAFVDDYAKNMEGASKANNEFLGEIEKAKSALKELEGQGKWFGDEDYDKAVVDLERLEQAAKEYKRELISPAESANPFGMDTLAGKIREAEIELSKLSDAGKGLGDEGYDEAYRKLALLKNEAKQYAAELAKTPEQAQRDAAAQQRNEQRVNAEIQKMEELRAKEVQAAMEADRLKAIGDSAQVSDQHIVDLNNELQELKIRQADLSNAGVGMGYEEFDRNSARIAQINRELREYKNNVESASRGTSKFSSLQGRLKGIMSKIGESVKKSGKSFLGLNKNANKSRMGMGRMLATSLLFSGVFRAISAVTSGVGEGFSNLAKRSGSTNASLSTLMSALTQLKNSLATAFSPILSVVAPILSTFINMLSKAATYVGMFFAAITGQKTFTKAVAVQQDYAAGLKGTAGAAGDAAKATEDAEKATNDYLSGLDEIQRWEAPDSDSGSGGGGGAGGVGDMFEEVEIPSMFDNLADKIKAAWEKADFTEIGTIVGNKLKNALNQVPWDAIQEGAWRIAKSFGTFLNGFFETPGLWEAVGKTIGQGLNTALIFVGTLLSTIHWDSIGKALTTSLYSAIESLDWSLLSGTISSVIVGLVDFVTGLIKGINWKELPSMIIRQIKEFLAGIKWGDIFGSIGGLIGTAIVAGIDLGAGLLQVIKDAAKNIKDYFAKYIKEAMKGVDKDAGMLEIGSAILKGILNGIIDAVKGIGRWLKANILNPLIEGFKDAFDIHSPSKNPGILSIGKNIFLGILEGILSALGSIGSWVKKHVLDPMLSAFKKAKSFFKKAGETLWNGITSAFGKVKKTLTAKITATKDAAFNMAKSAWDSIKNKTAELIAKAKDKSNGALEWLKNTWNTVKNKTAELVASAKNSSQGVLKTLKDSWDSVVDKSAMLVGSAVNNSQTVLGKLKDYWETIINKKSTLTADSKNTSPSVLDVLKKAWDAIVTRVSTLTGKAATSGPFEFLKNAWEVIKSKTANLVGTAQNKATSIINTLRSAWSSIYNKTVTLIGKATNQNSGTLSTLKKAWDSIKSKTVTLTAKILTSASNALRKIFGLQTGGIYKNGKWQPIEGYASGGSPRSARLFYANENGIPELIGRIGSNTAVMNNGQIVASVAAGVYQAVVSAFGQLQNYFASMTLSLANIPTAIERMQPYMNPITLNPPVMASGTVIPPKTVIDAKSVEDLQQTIAELRDLLRQNNIPVQKQSTGQSSTYHFVGQINRRTLFEEFMTEAQLVRSQTGQNPFEMA